MNALKLFYNYQMRNVITYGPYKAKKDNDYHSGKGILKILTSRIQKKPNASLVISFEFNTLLCD